MSVEDLALQHAMLLAELDKLWRVFVGLVFVGILFMVAMSLLAIWSVQTVTRQHQYEFRAILELLAKVLHAHDD